jgi:hypothetical protein
MPGRDFEFLLNIYGVNLIFDLLQCIQYRAGVDLNRLIKKVFFGFKK